MRSAGLVLGSSSGDSVRIWRRIAKSALKRVSNVVVHKFEADQDTSLVSCGFEPDIWIAVLVKPKTHGAHGCCEGSLCNVRADGPHSGFPSECATQCQGCHRGCK